MTFNRILGYGLAISALAFVLVTCAGCATPLDPVVTPPKQYQTNGTVAVTFADPLAVPFICARRGALGGLPLAAACADENLITIANPCTQPGSYARRLCHELGHANGWK